METCLTREVDMGGVWSHDGNPRGMLSEQEGRCTAVE